MLASNICLKFWILTCSFGLISGDGVFAENEYQPCLDHKGKEVAHGDRFFPLRSDPCTQCTCLNGTPQMCIAVWCSPPENCRQYHALNDKCCEFVCLDRDFTNKASGYGTYPGKDGSSEESSGEEDESLPSNVCVPDQKVGIEWLLAVRNADYGWGRHTPRAVIALVVNHWKLSSPEDISRMKLQLDVEITNALLRNMSSPIASGELALYIQALVAVGRNPRDFHGIDLVAGLLFRMRNQTDIRPYLALALCDANALALEHLLSIRKYLLVTRKEAKDVEMKAIALKAFACAKKFFPDLNKYHSEMLLASESLSQYLEDGTMNNIYTTAYIVQALIASDIANNWAKEAALEYTHSSIEQNVLSIYSSELALKASIYPFIRTIHPTKFEPATKSVEKHGHHLHYTLRNDLHPDVHLTITIKVPKGINFFELMKLSAEEDPKFRFSYYLDAENHPMVYAVDGIHNDPEKNLFWRLCRQERVHDNPNEFYMKTIHQSPILESAEPSHHFFLWYRETACERSNH